MFSRESKPLWKLQLETGGNPPPRKRKYKEQDKRIKTLKDRMNEGTVSIADFVSAITHLVDLLS